jgi:GT2 family glycosyltransferase
MRSLSIRSAKLQATFVVVDNASEDGSADAVEAAFPEATVIRNEKNLGFAAANNAGMAQGEADFYALVNSDIDAKPGCLETLVEFMEERPQVGLCGPRILNADGSLQPSCFRFPTMHSVLSEHLGLHNLFPHSPFFAPLKMLDWNHDTERAVDGMVGCFWLARHKAVAETGELDERFFFYREDVDWCKRFWQSTWEVRFCPDAVATHFGGSSTKQAPTRFFIERQRAAMTYWRKHHGRTGAAYYATLLVLGQSMRALAWIALWLAQPSKRRERRFLIQRSMATIRWVLFARNQGYAS